MSIFPKNRSSSYLFGFKPTQSGDYTGHCSKRCKSGPGGYPSIKFGPDGSVLGCTNLYDVPGVIGGEILECAGTGKKCHFTTSEGQKEVKKAIKKFGLSVPDKIMNSLAFVAGQNLKKKKPNSNRSEKEAYEFRNEKALAKEFMGTSETIKCLYIGKIFNKNGDLDGIALLPDGSSERIVFDLNGKILENEKLANNLFPFPKNRIEIVKKCLEYKKNGEFLYFEVLGKIPSSKRSA